MAYCCVPGCESCQRRECDRDLSFHRFPSDPPTRRAWVDRIRTLEEYVDPYFQVTDSTRVCGRHFTEDCKASSLRGGPSKLKRGSVPTLFTGCRPATRRSIQVMHRDRQRDTKATTAQEDMETHSREVAELLKDHSYSKNPLTVREQLQATRMELDSLEENGRLLKSEQLFVQRLHYEPEAIMFHTGFKDYSSLKAFYLALQPTPEAVGKWSHVVKQNNTEDNAVDVCFHTNHLCLFDQLFLFLCFVRRGLLPVNMQLVSEDIMWTTCVTWCHYLFFMLGALPVWLSRPAVDELMPPFFTTTFPKTRVVLDLIKIRVQLATCTTNSSAALKSLVGIAPSGSISFVSSVYTGSITDKDVVRESGILNLLEPGDEVMADECLEIKDVLDVIGVKLVSPTLGPNGPLNQYNATHTRDIGHLKNHVEKAKSRIREYHIFSHVPSALCGSVNQLWTVCALLINFQGPLV